MKLFLFYQPLYIEKEGSKKKKKWKSAVVKKNEAIKKMQLLLVTEARSSDWNSISWWLCLKLREMKWNTILCVTLYSTVSSIEKHKLILSEASEPEAVLF